MSYRERIFKIPKSRYDDIKNLSKEQIEKQGNEPHSFYYDYILGDELHTFGNNSSYTQGMPMFLANAKMNEILNEDTTLVLLTKDKLKEIILKFRERAIQSAVNSYELIFKIKDDPNEEDINKLKSILQRDLIEVKDILRLNFDEKDKFLSSWYYVYDMFNLLYIYKTTNWETEILGIYGS